MQVFIQFLACIEEFLHPGFCVGREKLATENLAGVRRGVHG
jgi:hypothetical protein